MNGFRRKVKKTIILEFKRKTYRTGEVKIPAATMRDGESCAFKLQRAYPEGTSSPEGVSGPES